MCEDGLIPPRLLTYKLISHVCSLQQWLEMCPRSQHCPLCRTSCSQSKAVISVYLTHFGREGQGGAEGGSGPAGGSSPSKRREDGDGTAEAKFTQDKVLTLVRVR